jgi:hypothetical protein
MQNCYFYLLGYKSTAKLIKAIEIVYGEPEFESK